MARKENGIFECRKIVAATDFSETAANGVAWAAEIARTHGAHLTILHAVQQPTPVPGDATAWDDYGSALQQAARERLNDTARPYDDQGFEVHTRLLVGPAVDGILEVVRQLEADLIVVGTRGLSGLRHLFLGSTAERLVRHSECPVLTTHAEAKPRPVTKILVPTDFSGSARRAAEVAREIVRGENGPARLILLHAYHLPIEYSAYGAAPVAPAFLEESRVRAEADLQEIARSLERQGLEVETLALAGYPAETILETAEAHEVDLIAMGTTGRSGAAHFFLGSTAERVVQRAHCPVLTLRERKEDEEA